jgi:hypothetical protein
MAIGGLFWRQRPDIGMCSRIHRVLATANVVGGVV